MNIIALLLHGVHGRKSIGRFGFLSLLLLTLRIFHRIVRLHAVQIPLSFDAMPCNGAVCCAAMEDVILPTFGLTEKILFLSSSNPS